jgi:hypothetical protein
VTSRLLRVIPDRGRGEDRIGDVQPGALWTIETTPAPNGKSVPEAISCTAVTTCTLTGEYFPNDGGTTDSLAYQLH